MALQKQSTNSKPKKKLTQKWWFWVIVVVLVLAVFSPKDPSSTSTKSDTLASSPEASTVGNANAPAKTQEPSVPAEYKSALAQANSYSSTMHLSKKGIYDQLVSEYGGKFQPAAAQYAIDNVKADWNANALAQAKTYQNDLHLSPAAVRSQLISDNGAKFTATEADYAVLHLND